MGFRLFVAITIVAWFSLTLGFGQGPVNSTPFVPNFTSRSSDEDQAIKTLRVFHSVQVVYSLGAGKGDFCSPTELFNESLIDADVANASGVPAMVSKSGKKCLGTGAPFHRYIFVATFKPKSVQQDSTFSSELPWVEHAGHAQQNHP